MAFLTAIPATVAGFMGTTTAGLAAGVSLIGTGISALSSIFQGQTTKELYERNAEVARRSGEAAQESEKAKVLEMSRRRRQLIGAQVAGYSGAGLDLSGSPLDVIANSYTNYERDIQTGSYNADVANRTGQSQGDIYQWGADRAGMAGFISGGSTILNGVGRTLLKWD